MRIRTCTALLPVALLLAACGQKGELYVPSPEREAIATLPAAPAEEEDGNGQAQPRQ
jgi:predicted small lipoprotein YifL